MKVAAITHSDSVGTEHVETGPILRHLTGALIGWYNRWQIAS